MSNLKSTIEKLGRAQQGLVTAADSVDPAEWNNLPGLTCWSAAQLVAHLCQVERGVLAYADRVIRKTALPVTFFKRVHLPIALLASRIIKRKTLFRLSQNHWEAKRPCSQRSAVCANGH